MTEIEMLELELLAEESIKKMEARVEGGLAMIECLESLSPAAYLEIVEEMLID